MLKKKQQQKSEKNMN